MSSYISLTHAVTSGDENAVSALLAKGADVNERTSGGQTALILAVICGNTNLVQLLIKAGADPQQRDNLGLNAIEWAQRRGLTEALNILTDGPSPSKATRDRIVIDIEEPPKRATEVTPTTRDPEIRESLREDEKSRRWIAGMKQRLDEQALQRMSRIEVEPEIVEPVTPPPEPLTATHSTRIITPPPTTPATTGKRKRCPQCNAIYNSELLAYCSHHIVALVDADEPIVTQPPPKTNPPLFWMMVIFTLTGSIILGSLITAYLYRSNQAAARPAGEQLPVLQKGLPQLSEELAGKAVSLPEAECPVQGSEPASGIVVVQVKVDKTGHVNWAQGSGGDWLMRGCSTDAAMKSTFAPEKLRRRETEGTITYTFKP